jgi:hypothetical protein
MARKMITFSCPEDDARRHEFKPPQLHRAIIELRAQFPDPTKVKVTWGWGRVIGELWVLELMAMDEEEYK